MSISGRKGKGKGDGCTGGYVSLTPFPDGPFCCPLTVFFFSIDVGILGARWPNVCVGASIGVMDVVMID